VVHGYAGLGRGGDDLHRREGVYVHARYPGLDRADQVGVRGAGQLRVDAALHADLGRAVVPGFHGPSGDLVHGQPVRVGVPLPLRERAEPAPDVTDVGEVDVPVDDVGDIVADGVAAYVVGDAGQRVEVRAVAGEEDQRQVVAVEQGRGVVGGQPERGGNIAAPAGMTRTAAPAVGVGAVGWRVGAGCVFRGDAGGDRRPVAVDGVEVAAAVAGTAGGVDRGVQVGTARGLVPAVRFLPRPAGGERTLGGQTRGGVGEGGDVPGDARVDPGFAAQDVLRVRRQPLDQPEPGRGGVLGQDVDGRPGALRIDVVGGHRGHAAPVVDAGAEHQLVLAVGQVRRSLT